MPHISSLGGDGESLKHFEFFGLSRVKISPAFCCLVKLQLERNSFSGKMRGMYISSYLIFVYTGYAR